MSKGRKPRAPEPIGFIRTTRCVSGGRAYWIASVRIRPEGEFGSVLVVPGNFLSEPEAVRAAQAEYSKATGNRAADWIEAEDDS